MATHADEVATWNMQTVTRWIKSLQEEIEGKQVTQINNMITIIGQRGITGKKLAKASNFQQLLSLFDYKITEHTARILRKHLTAEKNAFEQKKRSKKQIKAGKWNPKVGEKIKCVDKNPKYHAKSFSATIKKIETSHSQTHAIMIKYDSFSGTESMEWVKKSEWAKRITILGVGNDPKTKVKPANIPPIKAAAPLMKNQSSGNTFEAADNEPAFVKNKSVPPSGKTVFIPPFANKLVTTWSAEDVQDWIEAIQFNADSKYNEAIKKHKATMKKIVFKNEISGKLLMKYGSGERIYATFSQYGVSKAFCNKLWTEFNVVISNQNSAHSAKSAQQQPFGYSTQYTTKKITHWTCKDLQGWVKSLDLQKEKEVIAAVALYQMTGIEFAGCESAEEIATGLNIDQVTAAKLFRSLRKVKPFTKAQTQAISTMNNDAPPTYHEVKRDDASQQRYLMDNPPKAMFEIGQKVEASDKGGKYNNWYWYDAIIKDVNKVNNMVKIGWLNDKWASSRFDKWFTPNETKTRIRDPVTKQPYTTVQTDASYAYKKADGSYSQRAGGSGYVASSAAMNPTWKRKPIDSWTCNELQEWIHSLDLRTKVARKVVEAISEQEIGGTDFNSMEAVSDIRDSFDIEKIPATQIFSALEIIRAESNDDNANPAKRTVNIAGIKKKNSGITGLDNLRNTCFINAVIQGLLQTPGLVQFLRLFNPSSKQQESSGWVSNFWGSSKSNQIAPNMLEAFIEVTAAAMEKNAKYTSIAPRSIVKHLRSSDVKFTYGEQGDALSAVSKMIEMLDKNIIAREKKKGKVKDAKKHPGSWHIEVNEENDEEEILAGNLLYYNPYKSVIREYMHFVERNLFTCMKCGWQEARYDIKEKVLLPLKDHNTTIFVDIYIPSIKGDGPVFAKHECVILDYCPVQTLKYQIFQKISENIGDKIKFDLKNVAQISIRTIKPDNDTSSSEWIEECEAKKDCSTLTRKNKSVFAVVDARRKNKSVTVTIFHVRLDKKGNADPKASYLEFDEMKNGQAKLFGKVAYPKYPKKYMQIFFNEQIFNADYECVISEQNNTIIVIWTHKDATHRFSWKQPDIDKVFPIWKCEIWTEFKPNVPKYQECLEFIAEKMDGYKKYESTLVGADKKQWKEKGYLKSLQFAKSVYQQLANNQNEATNLVYAAFARSKQSMIKRKNRIILDICEGFATYCSTKVMDRGAVLKCRGQCNKKCDVFKQETKIVRFPNVLIFAIDRYINDQKFTDIVGYEECQKFDGNKYELYAVCNHSGGLGYGHYWAFVKGIDDNSWYNADDSRISTMNINRVENQATAILLFYKKIQ